MAFWGNEDKGSKMKGKDALRSAHRAVVRGFKPAVSAFLAFTMVFGSIPAPAYAEMIDEAAHAIAVAQQGAGQQDSAASAGEDASAAKDAAAPEDASEQDAAPAPGEQDASATALYDESEELASVVLGGSALSSKDAAVKALKDAGATDEAAQKAADTVLNEVAPKTSLFSASNDESDPQAGSLIDTLEAEWLTEDVKDDKGNLTITPDNDAEHTLRLRLSFVLSGEHDYEAGDVTITVPGKIFTTRDGNPAGRLTLPVPAEPTATAGWNYRHDTSDGKDVYVITNTQRMSAATQGYMEFAIGELIPHKMVDMQYSRPFTAHMQIVTRNEDVLEKDSEGIAARFDTHARIQDGTVKKNLSGAPRYVSANSKEVALAAKVYEDAKNFVVVDWYITCYADANQGFTLTIRDEVQDDLGGVILDDNAKENENGKWELTTSEGTFFGGPSPYTRVSVAYPASKFKSGETYMFSNKATVELVEADPEIGDDKQEKSTGTFTAKTEWECYDPVFVYPGGHFNMFKYGNNNKQVNDAGAFGTQGNASYIDADFWANGNSGNREGFYGLYGTALNDIRNGESIDMSYTLNTVGYQFPWTYKEPEGEAGQNPQAELKNYGKTPVTMTTENGKLTLDGKTLQQGEDFTYTSVTFPVKPVVKKVTELKPNADGTMDFSAHDSGAVKYETDNKPESTPDVVLQIKTADNAEWHAYATASWTGGKLTITMSDGSTPPEGTEVPLPADTTDVRTVTTSTVAAMLYYVRVGIQLNATADLQKAAKDAFDNSQAPSIVVKHDANMVVSSKDTPNIFTIDKREAANKLAGYTTDVRASMSSTIDRFEVDDPSDFDSAKNRAIVHVNATVQKKTHITDPSVYQAAIENGDLFMEKGGTFYNLLPKGMTPNLQSVHLREGDTIRSVHSIENFRGTGRTMLVVSANLAPQMNTYTEDGVRYYMDTIKLRFDAWYNARSINAYGEDFRNVIAYQSDNEQIGNVKGYEGESDSPQGPTYNNNGTKRAFTTESQKILDAMTNLDGKEPNNPNTLYAAATGTVDPLKMGKMGLFKEVSVNGSDWFGTGVNTPLNVYKGGTYMYRFGTSIQEEKAKDLVFYESMESCVPGAENEEDANAPKWKGTIRSVDVSQLESLGCDPKLYISNKRSENSLGLDFYEYDATSKEIVELKENTDLNKKDVWTQITPDELENMSDSDRANITAIAIDARTGKDGNPFTLKPGVTALVLVRMMAPAGAEADKFIADTAYAFNDICMASTPVTDGDDEPERKFLHEGYTKVGMTPYSLNVEKTWNDGGDRDGLRPSSVTVQLVADGVPVEGKTLEFSDSKGWKGVFGDLNYLNDNGEEIAYTLQEIDLPEYYHPSVSFDGTTLRLENRYTPETVRIAGTKTWENDTPQDRPATIGVELFQNDKRIDSKTVNANADGEWHYDFGDKPKRDTVGAEYTYTVKEVDFDNPSYLTTENGFDIVNAYHPYGNLTVSTTTERTTVKSADTEFTYTFTFLKEGVPLFDEFEYKITGEGMSEDAPVTGTVTTNGTIKLKNGQSVQIKELPKDVKYIVEQAEAAGFTAQGGSEVTGAIQPNATAEATFLNVYSSSVDVSFEAVKQLIGRELTPGRFAFDLVSTRTDEEGNTTEQIVRTAANRAPKDKPQIGDDGTVTHEADVVFGAITFTQDQDGKTFKYTMRERTKDGRGYTCDTSKYTVEVTVTDNGNGTMTPVVTYKDASDKELDEPLTFVNTYTAEGALSLQARKTLKGGDLAKDQFTFEVGLVTQSEDGKTSEYKPLENITAKNEADGLVKFPAIAYTQKDAGKSYLYAIREQVENEQGLTYDKHVALVRATVTDPGYGTLNVKTEYDGLECPCFNGCTDGKLQDKTDCPVCEGGTITSNASSLDFVNSYADEGLVIQKTLAEDEEADDPTHKFTFELELKNENGEPVEGLAGEFAESELSKVDPSQDSVPGEDAGVELAAAQPESAAKAEHNNPIAAFGAWATNALGSLFAPTKAYAAEVPAAEGIQAGEYGDSEYRFDPITGILTINARNLTRLTDAAFPWSTDITGVKKVEFVDGSTAGQRLQGLFYGMKDLVEVDFKNLSMQNTVNFESALAQCSSLKIVDLSKSNLANLNNLYGAFDGCSKLESVHFPESLPKLTQAGNIFLGCSSLTETNLLKIDAPKLKYLGRAFESCSSLETIELNFSKYSQLAEMQRIFDNCVRLAEVSLTGTSNQSIKAEAMFGSCKALKTLDSSDASIKLMGSLWGMFYGCTALEAVDLSGINASGVTSMNSMFLGCTALTSVNLSGINACNVTDMYRAFSGCSALESADLSGIKTDKVTTMSEMFAGCIELQKVTFPESGFGSDALTYAKEMFNNCEKLTTLELPSEFTLDNATDISYMFKDCSGLKSLVLPENMNTGKVEIMYGMFSGCSALTSIDLPEGFTAASVNNDSPTGSGLRHLFFGCEALTEVKFPERFVTSENIRLGSMFEGCKALTSIVLPDGFGAQGVGDAEKMFLNCHALTEINLPKQFNTARADDLAQMFSYCKALTSLTLPDGFTAAVGNARALFLGCEKLETINFPEGFETAENADLGKMFDGCVNLTSIELPRGFGAKPILNAEYMFHDCKRLESIVLPETFNLSSATNLRLMFSHCENVKEIILPTTLDTSHAKSMEAMFSSLYKLEELKLPSGFSTASATDLRHMFYDCRSLSKLELPESFDTSAASDISYMFDSCSSLSSIYLPAAFTFMGAGTADPSKPDANYCELPSPKYGNGWILLGEDGKPAEGATAMSRDELRDTFNGTQSGWYAWNTFLTVTFNANGGLGGGDQVTINALNDNTLTPPAVMKFGGELTGWDTKQGVAPDNDPDINLNEDATITLSSERALKLLEKHKSDSTATLYAHWKKSEGAGEETSKKGVYRFSIPAGYKLELPDVIPSGTSYKVTEVADPEWKLESSENTFGVVTSSKDMPTAAFVNARVEAEGPQTTSATIQVGKMLNGAWAGEVDGFKFQMAGVNPETNEEDTWEGKLHDGGTVAFPTLTWNENVLDADARKSYSYTITEVKGDNATIEYDTSTITATVTISRDDSGVLVSKVTYSVDGEEDSAGTEPVFHNETKPGTLNITKRIEGVNSTEQAFSFMVNVGGKPYAGEYAVDSETKQAANGVIELVGAQAAVISGLPAGAPYSVEEINLPSGWTQSADPMNASGTIAAGNTANATFTNTYSATGSAQLMAYKSFPGGVLEEGAFSFSLYKGTDATGESLSTAMNGPVDTNETVPGEEDEPVANPHFGHAPVYFPELTFSTADGASGLGEHEFAMAENELDMPGVTFDESVYGATVEVTDRGDGTLATSVVYKDPDGKERDDAPVFKNTPQEVGLNIAKKVTNDFTGNGDVHENDEFTFNVSLFDATGAPLKEQTYKVGEDEHTWKSDTDESGISTGEGTITLKADQTAEFTGLPYGTSYKIAEQPKKGWTLDPSASMGSLDGTLTSVEDPTEVTVANTYHASGTLQLTARKDYDGKLENGMFTFELLSVNSGGEREVIQTKTNVGENVTFDPINYTLDQVGKSFTYQVRERNDAEPGVMYDETVYDVTVTPKDNGDGTLTFEQVIRRNVEVVDEIVFTNRRTFELPFTGGSGIGMAGVAVLVLGCAAYLIDRTRRRKV